jgi:hypothetical protein
VEDLETGAVGAVVDPDQNADGTPVLLVLRQTAQVMGNGVMDRMVWFALSILTVLLLGAATMLLVKVIEPLNG